MYSNKILFLLFLLLVVQSSNCKDYKASFFGIESNGTTLNTTSIQKAIDYIHKRGGGRLVFDVGRFTTGSIYLKSKVTIQLNEGAVLVGSLNPFDYDRHGWWTSMIFGFDQDSIGITGQGVIDGRGYQVAQNVLTMVHRGILKDQKLRNDRPIEGLRPQLIFFKRCSNINIEGILLKNPASWTQQYDQCSNLLVDNITVEATSYWNNDGIDVVDCDSVIIRNSYFNAADDAICLKSHHADFLCQNVEIHNNTARSSASGIKFGTYSKGGFKNISIINNTVFDTYRSAITFAAVDGGIVENIIVDSLKALNVGNAIFLRIGERIKGKKGSMKDITISNFYAEIAETKADAGYPYEGPIEHLARNISPASIIGLSTAPIENITLKNVEIHYPGGGNLHYAKVGLDELDQIPELVDKYPEFSMFKELPAWGFYIRHAKGLRFENVILRAAKADYRSAIVLDDVEEMVFRSLEVEEINSNNKKESVYQHRSSKIRFE